MLAQRASAVATASPIIASSCSGAAPTLAFTNAVALSLTDGSDSSREGWVVETMLPFAQPRAVATRT